MALEVPVGGAWLLAWATMRLRSRRRTAAALATAGPAAGAEG
jgi:hypothetical protein